MNSGAGDDLNSATDPLTDENSLWPNFVIGLDDTIDHRPVVAPGKAADRSGSARIPANTRCLVDQVFERGLPAVLHEMVSQPAPEQAGTVAAMLGAALLVAGLWQTSQSARSSRWHSEPLRAAHARSASCRSFAVAHTGRWSLERCEWSPTRQRGTFPPWRVGLLSSYVHFTDTELAHYPGTQDYPTSPEHSDGIPSLALRACEDLSRRDNTTIRPKFSAFRFGN